MSEKNTGSRRGFLGGIFLVTVGTAATALGACAAPSEVGAIEPRGLTGERVQLQPWMRHANELPSSIPAVRVGTDDDRDIQLILSEPITTKA